MTIGMKTDEIAISERSPVRLGLIIGILGLTGAVLAAAIWWAAVVSTKLDTVLLEFKSLGIADNNHAAELVNLRERVRQLELVGSPSVQELTRRITVLEKGKP